MQLSAIWKVVQGTAISFLQEIRKLFGFDNPEVDSDTQLLVNRVVAAVVVIAAVALCIIPQSSSFVGVANALFRAAIRLWSNG